MLISTLKHFKKNTKFYGVINMSDDLVFKKLLKGNQRAITFLYSLLIYDDRCYDNPTANIDAQLKYLSNNYSHNFNLILSLYQQWKSSQFDSQLLDAIEGDERQIRVLLYALYNLKELPKNYQIFSNSPYSELVCLCDYCEFEKIRGFNFNFILIRVKNSLQDLSWLQWEIEDNTTWAINYINKNKNNSRFRLDRYENRPSNNSNNEEEKKSFIAYFFDSLAFSDRHEAELFLLKMKRAYSQRKYRNENPERVASNYMLCKEVKIKLKEIAKKERLKLNETIELLINEAHKKLE